MPTIVRWVMSFADDAQQNEIITILLCHIFLFINLEDFIIQMKQILSCSVSVVEVKKEASISKWLLQIDTDASD